MAVKRSTEELYGIRHLIRDLAARKRGVLPKAFAFSLGLHLFCLLFYLTFYNALQHRTEDFLRLKTGDPRLASKPVPHEKKPSVDVGIVKNLPKKPEPTPAPPAEAAPQFVPSKWVQAKKPEAPKVAAPVPAPVAEPRPKPVPEPEPVKQAEETPPTPPAEATKDVQGPPAPFPEPEPVAESAQAAQQESVPGAQVAGYEHGTDALAEQEQPDNYADKLGAYIIDKFIWPDKAREERLSGHVRLRVALKPDGTILSYTFLDRSGHAVLDTAVEEMMARANPVPPIPPTEQSRLFDIDYNLKVEEKLNPLFELLP